MIETLSTYWQYLKYPRLPQQLADKKAVWKELLWLLILDLAFALVITIIYYTLLKFQLIVKYEDSDLFKYGFPVAMLLGVVVAPLAEELVFRWQLRKPKVSIWFVGISAALITGSFLKNDNVLFAIYIAFFIATLTVTILTDKLKRLKAVHVFRNYYVFLFYYTAIIFGYVHMSNIKGLTLSDPSFILYIGSQIFGGLTMGYIRVKYGLKYSMLLHAVFNAIMVPLAWLSM